MAALARGKALLWRRLYAVRYRYLAWQARRGGLTAMIALLALTAVSAAWIPGLQLLLERQFAAEAQLGALHALFLTLGGALVGAAAIVSSLVLFAMQVNIERMPHGLFRRLSADRRLLSAFAATFLLAITVASLSMVPGPGGIGLAVFIAFWATALVLALFLYGYRRALILVNPMRQLEMVASKARRDLHAWVRGARRAAPLFAQAGQQQGAPGAPQHDLARLAFFQVNPGWTDGAMQAVRYAVSFARRYAEQGDHEVSAAAMTTIVAINSAYVEAKGRTFFAQQLLLDNPLTTDGFINDTLEHLRQTARIGLTRGDERQIEQTLRAMLALARVYLAIDYASPYASRTHAHLAAGYLSGEVERIIRYAMVDVLMEGLRLMGQCADMFLATEGPQGITTLTQKIGVISCVGTAAREDYRPVTLTGVEQLARLSFNLLRTRGGEVHFAAQEIRGSMKLIARLLMALPDNPLTNIHSTYLAPYYSATSMQGLSVRLSQLVNSVAGSAADDEAARQVIDNFAEWAEDMYEPDKELLLEAVAKRSHFTFDMIHWISSVTAMLLAVSNAAACDEHPQSELRKHASWLIAVLSWIPDDEETVNFIENFQFTETLFKSAIDAQERGCADIAESIGKMLVSWMFKAGRHHTGWAILERSVYGLATLALANNDPGAVGRLKAEITAGIAAGGLPDQERRDHAALEIRARAAALYQQPGLLSAIEHRMGQLDHQVLQPLLEEIADLISPETQGQAAQHGFF